MKSLVKNMICRNGFWLACLSLLGATFTGRAQEQQQGVCAPVKMVINQKLAIERIGFQATMEITCNDPNDPITDFSANLTFENPIYSTNGVKNDASSLFFVQPPTFQNIQNANGTGVIMPGQTATVTWFIIPTTAAGGTTPAGIRYQVGATLGAKIRGTTIPSSSLAVFPAPITVQPDA